MSETTQSVIATIDSPMDRRRIGDMKIEKFGGVSFAEYREAVEFAKVMTQAKHMIPKFLKNNVGDCLGVITQALRWKLEPFWLAQHSYVARDNEDTLIAYDAAAHAAIVLSAGNLNGRPSYHFRGEGEERTCTVVAFINGQSEPMEYTTPPIKQCRPPFNQEKGAYKGSPLWAKDPDQQLGYYAMRNWARRHCPDVLGGVYDREEFQESSQDDIIPPSPNLLQRLSGRIEGQGFHPDNVDNGVAAPIDPQRPPSAGAANSAEGASTPSAPSEAAGEPEPKPAAKTKAAAKTHQGTAAAAKEAIKKKRTRADEGAAGEGSGAEPGSAATSQAASPPPQPSEPAVEVFPEPYIRQKASAYVEYAHRWIKRSMSSSGARRRWDEERKIRANLAEPLTRDQQLGCLEALNEVPGQ